MCLAIPYKIKSINGNIAIIKDGLDSKEIDIRMVSGVKKNDWILINTNVAVSKISQKDALKTIKLLNEMKTKEG